MSKIEIKIKGGKREFKGHFQTSEEAIVEVMRWLKKFYPEVYMRILKEA